MPPPERVYNAVIPYFVPVASSVDATRTARSAAEMAGLAVEAVERVVFEPRADGKPGWRIYLRLRRGSP